MDQKTMFLKTVSKFLAVFLLTFIAYFSLANAFPTNYVSVAWQKGCFDVKDRVALEAEGQKILVLGGSNVLFGVSAQQMEEELGIPTINYAVHAGLRDYIFEKTKRIAKPGDIVLMPLEYEYYTYSSRIAFETRLPEDQYILAYDRPYFDTLPVLDRFNMLCQNGVDLGKNAYYTVFYEQTKDIPKGTYKVSDLNRWGDQTVYLYPDRKFAAAWELVFPENFEATFPNYQGARDILEFSDWCKENNVTLIATFPSIGRKEKYDTEEYKRKFALITQFYEGNGIPVLGEPSDFFYGEDLLYDTGYHLDEEGKTRRTSQLVEKLRGFLGRE